MASERTGGWLTVWLVFTMAAFALTVGSHAFLVRIRPHSNRVLAFFVTGALMGCALGSLVIARNGGVSPQLVASLLAYAFLCELYIFLFTLALSSISANLLARLYRDPLTSEQVQALYDSRRMVSNRVHRLLEAGFMEQAHDGVHVTKKGLRVFRLLAGMRAFFLHDEPAPATCAAVTPKID